MTNDQPDTELPLPPRVDLSALDPFSDPTRAVTLIGAIVTDGMGARGRSRGGVIGEIGRWARPMLVAAGIVLAVSVPVAVRSGAPVYQVADVTSPPPADTTSRFGLPASVAALVQGGRSPTPAEIVAAFNPRWAGAGGGQ